MNRPAEHTFSYRVYSVRRKDREPLVRFMCEALEASGCAILYCSEPNWAPFRIAFETPSGERMGLLAYAFFANNRETKNRPKDEYRFQAKYGRKTRENSHELWQDPYGVYTTIFIGISPSEQIFVGFDPVLHNPTKHFISYEFKESFVGEILASGWAVGERERGPGYRRIEPIEIIVGGTKTSFLDFVRFEREARGEDQGHRALLAERRDLVFALAPPALVASTTESTYVHQLAREFEMSEAAVLDLIAGARRLKMAVRGWVAEHHLVEHLERVEGVTDCRRIEEEGGPDIQLRFEGSRLLTVECKNVLRKERKDGAIRMDFMRTRISKRDECSRFYSPKDFDVLAACLHPRTERWEYSFAIPSELDPNPKCPGKLSNYVFVDARWRKDIRGILGAVARSR